MKIFLRCIECKKIIGLAISEWDIFEGDCTLHHMRRLCKSCMKRLGGKSNA